MQRAPRDQPHERAFQLADIGTHIAGDKERDLHRQRSLLTLRLLLQDGDLGFEIGGLNVDHQAPLEARAQTVFKVLQLLGRPVGRDDDLLQAFVQRVERMEELFLGALLAGQELDVVDEQHIHTAVLVAEAGHLVVAHGVDQLVRKLLAGNIADGCVRHARLHTMADGLHQVGLAHAYAAIHEERVVGLGRALRHSLRGSMRELVARADHEAVELVARVQLRGRVPVEASLLRTVVQRAVARAAGRARGVRGLRCKAAILTHTRSVGIGRGLLEDHRIDLQPHVVDGLTDQVAVAIAYVLELRRRDAHIQCAFHDVAEACRLEPRLKGLSIDLLLERAEDAYPLVERGGRDGNK